MNLDILTLTGNQNMHVLYLHVFCNSMFFLEIFSTYFTLLCFKCLLNIFDREPKYACALCVCVLQFYVFLEIFSTYFTLLCFKCLLHIFDREPKYTSALFSCVLQFYVVSWNISHIQLHCSASNVFYTWINTYMKL